MVAATRSTRKRDRPKHEPQDADGSQSDGEAPEEVTLAAGRAEADERRRSERGSRAAAMQHEKARRRQQEERRQQLVKEQKERRREAVATEAQQPRIDAAAAAGADEDPIDAATRLGYALPSPLDLLPEDVLQAMAQQERWGGGLLCVHTSYIMLRTYVHFTPHVCPMLLLSWFRDPTMSPGAVPATSSRQAGKGAGSESPGSAPKRRRQVMMEVKKGPVLVKAWAAVEKQAKGGQRLCYTRATTPRVAHACPYPST